MSKRARATLVGLAVIGLAVIVALLPGGAKYAALFSDIGIRQSLDPSRVSWDAKNAYVKCEGALADPARWPRPPDRACAAMALCANEAALPAPQRAALDAAMRGAGCGQ